MRELADQIETMKARWMTGGDAICPDGWSSALGERPNVSLIALAGQFTHVATRPTATELLARVPLPRLALPVIAGDLRPLFRRVLDGKTVTAGPVLALLAARGVTAHPADWMPSASTEAPDVYGPWIDWAAEATGADSDDTITAENWEEWTPHARRLALTELRRSAPADARALIAAKAVDVPAEQRVGLVALLESGLSEEDADVLDALTTDRSGKVSALAKTLLARLGLAQVDAEKAAEFSDFFEVQKAGILGRKEAVVARKTKNAAQRKRRWDLAQVVPLSAFAEQLKIEPNDLVRNFDLGQAAEEMVAMVAATGNSEQVASLLQRIKHDTNVSITHTLKLTQRLAPEDRVDIATRILPGDDAAFQVTSETLGENLGVLGKTALKAAPAFAVLEKHLKKDDGRVAQNVNLTLTNLGLIATSDAAQNLLDHFATHCGLLAADPRLGLLRLNAALKETP